MQNYFSYQKIKWCRIISDTVKWHSEDKRHLLIEAGVGIFAFILQAIGLKAVWYEKLLKSSLAALEAALIVLVAVFIYHIIIVPSRMYWEKEAEIRDFQDKTKKQIEAKDKKIFELTHLLDKSEIDISLEPSPSPSGEYVSIKVTNNNQDEFVLCRAIMKRMEFFEINPKHEKGGEWAPINLDRSSPLSWHHGGTDADGYKKVQQNPEFINIAKIPNDMNHLIRGNMLFTFIVEEPHKFGRYKVWIEVFCKQGGKSKTENWMGCIDMVDPMTTNRLTIMECDDVNEWRFDV